MAFEEGFYQREKGGIVYIHKHKETWIAELRSGLVNLSRTPKYFRNEILKKINPKEYLALAKSNIEFIEETSEEIKNLEQLSQSEKP